MTEEPRRLPIGPLLGLLLPVVGAAAGWGAAEMRNAQAAVRVDKLEATHAEDMRQLRAELRALEIEQAEERTWRVAHGKEADARFERLLEGPRRRQGPP